MVGGSGRYGSLAYKRQHWGVTAKQCAVYTVYSESSSVRRGSRHRIAESECDSGQFTCLPFQCAMVRILYDRLAADWVCGCSGMFQYKNQKAGGSRLALSTHADRRGRVKIDTRGQAPSGNNQCAAEEWEQRERWQVGRRVCAVLSSKRDTGERLLVSHCHSSHRFKMIGTIQA